ncbi:KGG domain-containing protein [Mesorhizobium yinganensis]|uniref:KGG domain-containing protein n=1 Tax=Mesorhizobium yinganensis TaxID=3157707 RepID=UPI0032B7A77D
MANRGGSHEQHVKAGQQSHKNDEKESGRGQQHAEGGKDRQQSGGERGGSGNFGNDRERASEAGRKGGQS